MSERSEPSERVEKEAKQHLVVFARRPRLGEVKTRLAATVGEARALEIYVALAERVVTALADCSQWKLVVRCAPDEGRDDVARWLGDGALVEPQGEGDLGDRMSRALAEHFAVGARRVIIVGTDCPDVGADVVQQAFGALETHDVVYGPALDGGYYLVGARRPVPELFVGVPWSSTETLARSLERARSAAYSVHLLAPLGDIDTEGDWRAWLARTASSNVQSGSDTKVPDAPRS